MPVRKMAMVGLVVSAGVGGCATPKEKPAPVEPDGLALVPVTLDLMNLPKSEDQLAAELYWRERPPGGLWVGHPPWQTESDGVKNLIEQLRPSFDSMIRQQQQDRR